MADTLQITMPQMGESVSEGTVLTWHKQEGDWVDKDETIVEVSTDKVDAEAPAPAAVPEGARVSPVARRVAAAHGVDLSGVSGTGTGGRIVKEDVLSQVN